MQQASNASRGCQVGLAIGRNTVHDRLRYVLRRQPGLSLTDFHRVWPDEHDPSHQVRLGYCATAQSHRVDDPASEPTAAARARNHRATAWRRCGGSRRRPNSSTNTYSWRASLASGGPRRTYRQRGLVAIRPF